MNLNPSDSIDISLFPGLRYLNVEKKAASSPEYLKSLAAHSPSYFDYLADSGKRVFNAQPFGTNYELNFPNDKLLDASAASFGVGGLALGAAAAIPAALAAPGAALTTVGTVGPLVGAAANSPAAQTVVNQAQNLAAGVQRLATGSPLINNANNMATRGINYASNFGASVLNPAIPVSEIAGNFKNMSVPAATVHSIIPAAIINSSLNAYRANSVEAMKDNVTLPLGTAPLLANMGLNFGAELYRDKVPALGQLNNVLYHPDGLMDRALGAPLTFDGAWPPDVSGTLSSGIDWLNPSISKIQGSLGLDPAPVGYSPGSMALPDAPPLAGQTPYIKGSSTKLQDLKDAKAYSDVKQYDKKHALMRQVIKQDPTDYVVDSSEHGFVGITHVPTGFKMHLPETLLRDLNLTRKAANLKAMKKDKGLANFGGGGQGSYMRMNTLGGQMKSDLTKATKDLGEVDEFQTPWEKQFPATAKYHKEKLKTASLNDAVKVLGYAPGVWYGENTSIPNRMTTGNLITGAGLSAAGLATIPILQYLFPERFEGKGGALAGAAVLAGMALPWAANLPHTSSLLNKLSLPDAANYDSQKFKDSFRYNQYGIAPAPKAAPVAAPVAAPAPVEDCSDGTCGDKSSSYMPYNTPFAKTHLADMLAEQLSSGYVDYGQAAGLMQRASQSTNAPWFTVGDLAKAAVGAGAGLLAGTVAAKGIGMFMNLSPNEQKVMQGTGAALGTLLNLGKFGF